MAINCAQRREYTTPAGQWPGFGARNKPEDNRQGAKIIAKAFAKRTAPPISIRMVIPCAQRACVLPPAKHIVPLAHSPINSIGVNAIQLAVASYK